MEDTDGTLYLSQMPSAKSLSRISQAKIPGSLILSSLINPTTLGVVTLGLEPPMAPGKIEPVSLYLASIFETHPCETRNCREMSHGRIPSWANSMMRTRTWLGNGRPLTNMPPN